MRWLIHTSVIWTQQSRMIAASSEPWMLTACVWPQGLFSLQNKLIDQCFQLTVTISWQIHEVIVHKLSIDMLKIVKLVFLSIILMLGVVKHSECFSVCIECQSLTPMAGRKNSVPILRDGEPFAALYQIYISLLICKRRVSGSVAAAPHGMCHCAFCKHSCHFWGGFLILT
jgi:hypothetical protein